ncbi:hypothetical protein QJS04_geneDACA017292 [Acorus gramineus]|uniref:Uncharacterized protein n=1 Tax=Acorus gramineus TaxID=55184 RepID=A0AAV9A2V8_ACOGR|nr:hypothetical protein QJS04_geneDACA017292 [Acorus gramineus]
MKLQKSDSNRMLMALGQNIQLGEQGLDVEDSARILKYRESKLFFFFLLKEILEKELVKEREIWY